MIFNHAYTAASTATQVHDIVSTSKPRHIDLLWLLVSKIFQRTIVNMFLPINFNTYFNTYVLGAQKNRLIETGL